MNIIRSISVLILFFGIIILTIYITRSYTLDQNLKSAPKKQTIHDIYLKKKSERPSKVFDKMFTDSSVWMGYTDTDIKNAPNSMNYYSKFNTQKYSDISD
tara:strand:+ start:825 stop:1124 length:300 start_codon:yes stop_codon:yes gene_type:complete